MGCGGSKAAKTENEGGNAEPAADNGGEGAAPAEGANGTNETPNQDNTDTNAESKTGEQTTEEAPAENAAETTGDDAEAGEEKTITEHNSALDGETKCSDTKTDEPSVLQDSEAPKETSEKVDRENEESIPKTENPSEENPKVNELETVETTVSE